MRTSRPDPGSPKARAVVAALALLAWAPLLGAAEGERVEVGSRFVPGGVAVSVFLPPGYDRDPGRRYPAVYFLHDVLADDRVLARRGVVERLRAGMRDGSVPEAILVAPRGGRSWFVDAYDGRRRFAGFLSDELVPWVDASYRTVPDRSGRAVAGISMGGYGALRWALTRPDLFAAAGGLSPALLQLSWRSVSKLPFLVRLSMRRVFGSSPAANAFAENDLYALLLSRSRAIERPPEVLLRCGTEDEYDLHELTGYFGRYLDAFGVPNEVHLEPGAHDWEYWKSSAPDLLAALCKRLAAPRAALFAAGGTP